jgi:hypothetical protein
MSTTVQQQGGLAEEHEEKRDHGVSYLDKLDDPSNVVELNAANVALAAAIAAQKPSLLSKNMLKLYFIMGVGYLVSTMNGFGKHLLT